MQRLGLNVVLLLACVFVVLQLAARTELRGTKQTDAAEAANPPARERDGKICPPSACADAFAGSGWYCIYEWSWDEDEEMRFETVYCREITSEGDWNDQEFNECLEGERGIYCKKTTPGVPYASREAAMASIRRE